MILTGVFANAATIIIGALMGIVFKKGVPEKMNTSIMQGLGLCVLYIGISGSLKGENTVIVILSIIIGVIIGEIFNFDRRLQWVGDSLQAMFKFNGSNNSIAEGFVNCTIFFCVGAMSIVGSLQSGLTGNHETLFAKALIDGTLSLVMASTMGIGVAFSALTVFLYESLLTLSANVISDFLTTPVINEMTCVGSLLIVAIGLNMLKLTNIKVTNFILAPFIPIILYLF